MNQQWYNIGAFTFPGSWAATVSAFVITFLFLFFWNKKASDWYSNAVFYFILTWKLSVIVVDFGTVIKHPLTILYFHGGTAGYWMGITAVLIYTFIKKENPRHVIAAWVMTVLVYEGVFDILQGTFIFGGAQLILNSVLLLVLLKKLGRADQRVWGMQILIIFTLIQLLMNSFGGFEIGTPTLTYIVLAIVLLYLQKRDEQTEIYEAGRKN
ncbi:hypothetical protein [Bacillus sp. Marseille-Q1617]|uniref:hypothetical protein n=1 Tax=Bacillus sp. Marseille-Q1617 TaxID=2736887 RepID=UPI0015886EB3|nr:hypothetical protein [Bacillus sp. Marseille-Q1617]